MAIEMIGGRDWTRTLGGGRKKIFSATWSPSMQPSVLVRREVSGNMPWLCCRTCRRFGRFHGFASFLNRRFPPVKWSVKALKICASESSLRLKTNNNPKDPKDNGSFLEYGYPKSYYDNNWFLDDFGVPPLHLSESKVYPQIWWLSTTLTTNMPLYGAPHFQTHPF